MRREAWRLTGAFLGLWLLGLSLLPVAAGNDARVRLQIEVVGEKTGKPIQNAAVYVKFKEARTLWRDKKREWSVKTNREGKAVVPLLPEGRVLIQVVAKGWKTYGRYYTLRGPKQTIEVKLKLPKKWY